ncbi:MAG TPA: hypothetical protein VK211_23590 [Kamptonema sp.]|nr:hypothetical protein [Kamptonema sp.]
MLISTCPCCSTTLLRHIRSQRVYWFCRHCYQEMPNYENSFLGSLDTGSKLSIKSGLAKANVALITSNQLKYSIK